ncbi:MAG: phosphoribosylglycinamide formyltransferase [Kofleriaceae bacterium]|nr:phosphoribosylglycinamide formyltransferase [Candidatus Methylomirabilis lanthanidiphila]
MEQSSRFRVSGEKKLQLGVLVSGRGSNLQAIIDASQAAKIDALVAIVISDVADARALELARRHGIDATFVDPRLHTTSEEFDRTVIDLLRKREVDLVCLAGFMRLLSPHFIREYRHNIMNIHPALLPAFPGLHAQRQALRYGVKVSGCTVHFVDEGVDTGPIIMQAVVPVLDDDTDESLSARILTYEHQIYPQAIQLFAEGRLEIRDRRVVCHGTDTPQQYEKYTWRAINPS